MDMENFRFAVQSKMFRLYGADVIEGQFELGFNFEHGYILRERFPELIDQDLQEDLFYDGWSTYQVSKISPAIVGNTELEQYQCHHPQGNGMWNMPMPGLFESEYVDLDEGAYTGHVASYAFVIVHWLSMSQISFIPDPRSMCTRAGSFKTSTGPSSKRAFTMASGRNGMARC